MYWNRDRSRMLAFNHHVVTALYPVESKAKLAQCPDRIFA